MRLTNGQFVDKLLSLDIDHNNLVHDLEVCIKLLKKYGKIIISEKYMEEVKKVSVDVYNLLLSLKSINKSKVSDMKNILRLFKDKSKKYNSEFEIKTTNLAKNNVVEKFLKDKFDDSEVFIQENSDSSIKISGEGWFYKRDLDQDLSKLLGV